MVGCDSIACTIIIRMPWEKAGVVEDPVRKTGDSPQGLFDEYNYLVGIYNFRLLQDAIRQAIAIDGSEKDILAIGILGFNRSGGVVCRMIGTESFSIFCAGWAEEDGHVFDIIPKRSGELGVDFR